MCLFLIIPICLLFQSDEIPYLEDDLYSYELDYSFVNKPSDPPTTIDFTEKKAVSSSVPLPYVKVILELRDLPTDYQRYRVVDNYGKVGSKKKIKVLPVKIEIDMGFADDIKDQVGPNKFTVNLLDEDKEINRIIVFEFDSDGNMFVNGTHRGKI